VRLQAVTLETERLVLRPFRPADAKRVQELAGDPAVAEMTDAIPHPYPDGAAEAWIAGLPREMEQGTGLTLAICPKPNDKVVGAVSLMAFSERDRRASLGYWIGKPYWNSGFCTEAARAMVSHGFRSLGLNRVQCYRYERNPASGRVLDKVGFRREGLLRRHIFSRGRFEDVVVYGLLASEFDPGQAAPGGKH
jgi:ribosomal-protein-alanine N-acetyltransferase